MSYKVYKQCDRKAPRFRKTKWRYDIINKDLYNRFLKLNEGFHIEYDDFHLINEMINIEIRKYAVENREGIILPKGLGRIWLGLFPAKRNRLLETGVIDYNFNTGGFKGKICWDFDFVKYRIENGEYYGFNAHRDFKQQVSKRFNANPSLYMRIDSTIKKGQGYKKRKLEENERDRLNAQISDQSGEDNSQGS